MYESAYVKDITRETGIKIASASLRGLPENDNAVIKRLYVCLSQALGLDLFPSPHHSQLRPAWHSNL